MSAFYGLQHIGYHTQVKLKLAPQAICEHL